jgi:hypothetical protein
LEYYSSSKADLEKRQDEIAKRFLKLMGLGASHVDSDPDTDIDAGLNRRPGKVKVTPGKNFGDSENEDYGYQKGPNKTNTTQYRVKNDAQDIEAFKRIHTLIEGKKSPSLDQTSDRIWNTSPQEERERIKEFWLSLGPEERSSLVKVEKDAVLRKMKEQQNHSCSCTVCGQKRTAIEEELEVLYDAYYEELEQYRNHHDDGQLPPMMGSSYGQSKDNLDEDQERDENSIEEEEDDEDEWTDDESEEDSQSLAGDFYNFRNALTVQDGTLTVADDLLKNDGRKFIEMMEQLAERRMAREEEARGQSTHFNFGYEQYSSTSYESPSSNKPDDEDGEDIKEEEYDSGDDEYEEGEMVGKNPTRLELDLTVL